MTPRLYVIVASTRPGRVGLPVAAWFRDLAAAQATFDVVWVDLAEWNLPFLDEPRHPRLHDYVHDHTRRWSAFIERADAHVIVTPEYNHGYNAPLKNALDFLHHEWSYTPVGFVSYGGISAGARAVENLKPVLVELKMTPVQAVGIPFVSQHIQDGVFHAQEMHERAGHAMLNELERLEQALRDLRASSRQALAGSSSI